MYERRQAVNLLGFEGEAPPPPVPTSVGFPFTPLDQPLLQNYLCYCLLVMVVMAAEAHQGV